MNNQRPWSLRQLQHALRQAGWQRVPGPGSGYKHRETGRRLELYNYNSQHGCVEWHIWAMKRETPPT